MHLDAGPGDSFDRIAFAHPLAGLSVLWILLVIGRYAEVTAPALSVETSISTGSCNTFRQLSLSWRRLRRSGHRRCRFHDAGHAWCCCSTGPVGLGAHRVGDKRAAWKTLALTVVAVAAIALFVGQQASGRVPRIPAFATPVVQT